MITYSSKDAVKVNSFKIIQEKETESCIFVTIYNGVMFSCFVTDISEYSKLMCDSQALFTEQ